MDTDHPGLVTGTAAHIEAAFHLAPLALAIVDAQARWVRLNARFAQTLQPPGNTLADLPPPTAQAALDLHAKIMQSGQPALGVRVLTAGLGGAADLDPVEDWLPLSDASGAVFGVSIALRDGAENRAHRLRQLAEQRSAILDALPASIALLDAAGMVIAVNRGWLQFGAARGGAAAAQTGTNYLAACEAAASAGDAMAAHALQGLRDLLSGARSRLEMDYPCHAPGEAECWYRMVATPIPANGACAGAVVMHMDITAHIRAQQALEEREARLASIIETMPDALVIIDEHGRIEVLSSAAERMFGWRADEAIGKDVSLLMTSADGVQHGFYISRYKATGQRRMIGTSRVVSGCRHDGSVFPLELAVSEICAGGRRLFTGFARDLTEQRAAQARLQELQAEFLHISRLREAGAMVSALAHELNQPLTSATAALGAATRMLPPQAADEAELREAIDLAAAQIDRASRIVQNLRAFVSRGETDRHLERISKLVETASALALAGTGDRVIHVNVRIDPELPYVLVDRVQIQQVLVNLIRNAVQSMLPGAAQGEAAGPAALRRELRMWARETQKGEIEVAISDTGHGLTPEMAANLFQPFMTTKPCGMGVGLSICRSIIDAHGGRIWAEPNPGGGTVFRLTLPTAASEAANLAAAEP